MNTNMFLSGSREEAVAEFYKLQAAEYHHKYYRNESESDECIKAEAELLQSTFRELNVLEIACGTGFWTEIVAETANSIVATDVNMSMISEAGKRLSHLSNVSLSVADAYCLHDVSEGFSGAFAVLFWCHIPRQRIEEFLTILHRKLLPGSPVVFICQLEDSDVKTHKTDKYGNILALRRKYGKNFTILKNTPKKNQLIADLKHLADDIRYCVFPGSSYWCISYKTKAGK